MQPNPQKSLSPQPRQKSNSPPPATYHKERRAGAGAQAHQQQQQQAPQTSQSTLNLTSGLDYKELQKTLVNFQKAQMQLERTGKLSPLKTLSPLKQKEMINFKALENAGLINLNFPTDKKKVEGVKIELADIEKAFKILDEKGGGTKISLQELKKKIPAINPNFPLQEIPALTQGKPEMKSKELYELLKQNELEHFDPLLEAYNLLDPKGDGHIDIDRLEKVFTVLGYSQLDAKDREILLECLGHDGKITLNDLRQIFESENL